MKNMSFLNLKYNLSKRRPSRKPSRQLSPRDQQHSGLVPIFQPNLNEMRKVFDKFDANKDGKISRPEYRIILKAMGKERTVGEVDKIFKVADLDGDGFIDFDEFMEVHRKSGGVNSADIQSAFRSFDANNDGRISAEEVWEMLRRLGERCSLEDCRKMVRRVDRDADGMIDMDEFMTMMTCTEGIR